MEPVAGVALILGGAAVGLLGAFALWRRLPSLLALVPLAGSGALIGTGALLVQDHPGPADWVVTLAALAVLTPVHCRVLFGPPGRHAEEPTGA